MGELTLSRSYYEKHILSTVVVYVYKKKEVQFAMPKYRHDW